MTVRRVGEENLSDQKWKDRQSGCGCLSFLGKKKVNHYNQKEM